MNCGVSTACLYPMETEKSLSTLISLNFRLFEIFFNTYREIQPEYIKSLKKILQEHNCSVKSVHPFTSGFESMLLFSNYRRRYLDGLEFYKHYFEAAQLLGAKILVLHGQRDYANSSITEEEYFNRYGELYELGKESGITVAQENVNAFRSEDPRFITRMRSYTNDRCSFVFDIKQAVRAGVDPFDMCAAMGERIIHVHVNDNNDTADCLLPGEGTMDYPKLMQQLAQYHYNDDFIIEVYRKNFERFEQFSHAKQVIEALITTKYSFSHRN
ncbi:MAG TPA: sugar phosphate isomerase/epimerase [Oscillospiraceae bacterium]|nr:sugar phosphate isomerase/epimerase [Oscillospiraceae bacterium]